MFPPSLQHSPADVSAAGLTFHPVLGVVVGFTVRHPILADVLSGEHHAAGSAAEAADVPLLLQSQERLALLDLRSTSCTVTGPVDLDGLVGLDESDGALLTHTVLPAERHSVSDGKGLTADATDETLGVVGASEGRHHLSTDEGVAAVTAGPIQALVVCCADVLALLLEEPRPRQVTVTNSAGEASDVEVRVLHSDHLPFTDLPTALASDCS